MTNKTDGLIAASEANGCQSSRKFYVYSYLGAGSKGRTPRIMPRPGLRNKGPRGLIPGRGPGLM